MRLIIEEVQDLEVLAEADSRFSENKNLYIKGIFLQGNIVNKNRRMYPIEILDKQVSSYNEEFTSKGRAYGELGHPCLSESAEVLTENSGWKKINELVVGEKVYTLNPNTKNIEFQEINKTYKSFYTGNMFHIYNRTMDTLVTPNHDFLTYYRDGKPYMASADEINYCLKNNIAKLAKFAIPKTGNLLKVSPEKIEINSIEFIFKDFVAFLALYLAEGCVTKVKNRKNSYRISISQNEGEKSLKIQKLLNRLPIKFSFYKKNKKLVWTSYNRQLAEYLTQFGRCYDKFIDSDILSKLDQETSIEFIEWFVLGDGRGKFDTKYSKCDAFSVSERLIDDISIICVNAGKSFHKWEYIEENDIIIENRIIKAENKKPLYFISFLNSENIWLDKRFLKVKEVVWNDYVYCIEVDNGVFLAKDNGYCFWSGNSGPKINADRISHRIVELVKSGNDYIGKAVIIPEGMGKIVTGIINTGGTLAASSRALGSLKQAVEGYNIVQEDFKLATAADIVIDPSAPSAFVNGIYESAEFLFDEKLGIRVVRLAEQTQKQIRNMSVKQINEQAVTMFKKYLDTLAKS